MHKADYYESSTWLTEEEKTALDAKDKARKETVSNMNKRSNNFSINLDDGYAGLTLSYTSHVLYLSALYMNHQTIGPRVTGSTPITTYNQTATQRDYLMYHHQYD